MVTDNSQPYVDTNTDGLGHCYNVSVLCENGESDMSEMVCVSVGDACNPARNIWYTMQNNGRPIITWDAPVNSEDLSAYFVFRKCDEDGTYQRVKIISPTKHEYKETVPLENGHWYYYKVLAYYQSIECYSIPAQARYNGEYFVKIFISPESVDENNAQNIEIYPNPAKDVLTIKADNISNVAIYNSVGQKVFSKNVDADETIININDYEAGIYMVRIFANDNEVIRKITIIK